MNYHDQIIMRSLAARIAYLESIIEEETRTAIAEKDRRIAELETGKKLETGDKGE